MEREFHFFIEPDVLGEPQDSENTEEERSLKVRLDKWLWAARFFKTRALARAAVEAGKVFYNGQRSKPTREIELGAILQVHQGRFEKTVIIKGLSTRRRSTEEALLLFEETPESRLSREQLETEYENHQNFRSEESNFNPPRSDNYAHAYYPQDKKRSVRFLRRTVNSEEPETHNNASNYPYPTQRPEYRGPEYRAPYQPRPAGQGMPYQQGTPYPQRPEYRKPYPPKPEYGTPYQQRPEYGTPYPQRPESNAGVHQQRYRPPSYQNSNSYPTQSRYGQNSMQNGRPHYGHPNQQQRHDNSHQNRPYEYPGQHSQYNYPNQNNAPYHHHPNRVPERVTDGNVRINTTEPYSPRQTRPRTLKPNATKDNSNNQLDPFLMDNIDS